MKMMWLMTMLMVVGISFTSTVVAQEKKKKETKEERYMKRAQIEVDNMDKTIKFDEASKAKALELTYNYRMRGSDINAEKETLGAEKFEALRKENTTTYGEAMRALMSKEQKEAYKEWKKLPKEERENAPAQ